jgi:hypothetical protein
VSGAKWSDRFSQVEMLYEPQIEIVHESVGAAA